MLRVSRTAVELFGLSIHWYALLIVTGIGLGVWLAAARERRYGLPKDTALDVALVCVPAAILGARLYYVAFSWKDFAGGPWWRVFAVWEGGMAVYGGLIAAFVAGAVFAGARKLSFMALADLTAPCIALGQAIGRWGNFVNQEAYGAAVTNPGLMFFPAAVNIGGSWHYATFFYESAWCLLTAAVLLTAEKKCRRLRRGDIFLGYALLYGLERAVVEGLRTDSLYLGPVRVSQGISLLAALAASVFWAVRLKHAPKALRVLSPLFAAAAIPAGIIFGNAGTFGAAAMVLITTAAMMICEAKYTKEQEQRRIT